MERERISIGMHAHTHVRNDLTGQAHRRLTRVPDCEVAAVLQIDQVCRHVAESYADACIC